MPVRLAVLVKQLDISLTDFHNIWCFHSASVLFAVGQTGGIFT